MSIRKVAVVAMAVLLCGGLAAADTGLVDLYSADDYQYFGSGANGKSRSQHFSPAESTPTTLDDPQFDSAAFKIALNDGEALAADLMLYSWNTDYTTTIGGAPIASMGVNLSGPFDDWVTLACAPQDASGQYLLRLAVGTVTGIDFGLFRSNSNDGGANNDAFNDSGIKTDREYQVRLNGVPEPSALGLLLLGSLGMLRRRR